MATREELADILAQDVIRAMAETGDDRLWEAVAKEIGTSSPTSQEAFVTAMRIRLSEQRARKFLAEKVAELKAKAGA